MWRKNITTASLVVLGVLLIAVVVPNSKWGWNAQDQMNVPMVNASWTQLEPKAGENNGLTQITVAPPYIILDDQAGLARPVVDEGQLRISIQTMAGSYSEYVASMPSAPVAMPVLFIGSLNSGTLDRRQLDLALWK